MPESTPAANDIRLDDGYATIITFANIPNVKLYEKEITPPGMTAGGVIDTTTMRNQTWRTMAPRNLKSLTPVTAVVAYATSAIPDVMGQVGINQEVTITFPDGSSITFWGWIESFTPAAMSEGAQPTATINITPGNIDDTGAEVAPEYNAPAESSTES